MDVLALALKLNCPVWSNDNDFDDVGVERLTTAQLLRRLGLQSLGLIAGRNRYPPAPR